MTSQTFPQRGCASLKVQALNDNHLGLQWEGNVSFPGSQANGKLSPGKTLVESFHWLSERGLKAERETTVPAGGEHGVGCEPSVSG